jgi:hypothetical protein
MSSWHNFCQAIWWNIQEMALLSHWHENLICQNINVMFTYGAFSVGILLAAYLLLLWCTLLPCWWLCLRNVSKFLPNNTGSHAEEIILYNVFLSLIICCCINWAPSDSLMHMLPGFALFVFLQLPCWLCHQHPVFNSISGTLPEFNQSFNQ